MRSGIPLRIGRWPSRCCAARLSSTSAVSRRRAIWTAPNWIPCSSGDPTSPLKRFPTTSWTAWRSEERRVGKEGRSRWSPAQAEDGIRDTSVTGVQTCALPIYAKRYTAAHREMAESLLRSALEQYVSGVAQARHLDRAQLDSLLQRGPYLAAEALSHHFVDRLEIGRASCRERGEIQVVTGTSRRRHTRYIGDWSSDVCSSDLCEAVYRCASGDGRVAAAQRA